MNHDEIRMEALRLAVEAHPKGDMPASILRTAHSFELYVVGGISSATAPKPVGKSA